MLNGKELKVGNAQVDRPVVQSFSKVSYDQEREQITLTFPQEIPASSGVVLTIEFTGEINDKLVGFYRSSFDDPTRSNEKRYLAVTHFEPTDARRAFPCWDEPNVKATFDIALEVLPEFAALSNMHVVEEREVNGKKRVKFATTPVMSTYLVAFAVGPLEFTEQTNKNGTVVRVYTTPGIASQGEFALECACRILEFFSEYFGIPYPMKKMDMIGIPDFSMGAMENWGLVTYRTTALLFDPKSSTTQAKQRVTSVVAHELAHQWFGNLVTMDWWTDLWLNEGFATWAGTLATDHLFPEWQVWTEFIVEDSGYGLQLDSLRSSHPIEVDVKSPSEIGQIFDAISYSKGASVIRMLVAYLGEETFRKGIHSYLKKFEYKNAVTNDLWDALELVSGKPVRDMMTNWTRTVGYPIVHVEREGCCCLRLTQHRYLTTGDVSPDEDSTLWRIPLGLFVEGSESVASELSTRSQTVTLEKNATFRKVNKDSTGFFRTFYSPDLMESIGQAISEGKLSAEDRIGILNDAFNLAYSGHHNATIPLGLIRHFSEETNYMVWLELSSRLSELQSVLWEQDKQVQEGLRSMIRNLCKNQLSKLGFDFKSGEDDITGLLRVLIIALAGRNKDEHVLQESKKRFESFFSGNEGAIHPNLRGTVFKIAVENGGSTEFDLVKNIYLTSQIADQKLQALKALCATKSQLLQESLFNSIFTGEVKSQDTFYVVACSSSNVDARKFCWSFVKNNWQKFVDLLEKGSCLLGEVASCSTNNFTALEVAEEVESFFSGQDVTGIDVSIKQSLEQIKNSSKFLSRDFYSIQKYFSL